MAKWTGNCPGCDLPLELDVSASGAMECPICNTVLPVGRGTAPARGTPATTAQGRTLATRQRHVRLAVTTLCGLLVLGASISLVVLLGQAGPRASHEAQVQEPKLEAAAPIVDAEPPESADDEPVPVLDPTSPPINNLPSPTKSPPRPATPPPPRPATSADPINRAIARGVAYLRKVVESMPAEANSAALVGLALLECGVSADDPSIVWLADAVRARNASTLQTYELALHILLFDRLGRAQDEALIREAAELLCRTQYDNGTWSYRQPFRLPNANPLFLQKPLVEPSGDHSNTQFAALALWVAARHGVAVDYFLRKTDDHFRKVQNTDGSWGYRPASNSHRDSMTCAGLLCLALGHVLDQKHPVQWEDASLPKRQVIIARGFYTLGQRLTKMPTKGSLGADSMGQIYFLWSLERMAVIYNIKTIAKKEWYPWAAGVLVDSQREDGSWSDAFPGAADTSFALLILKRSNRASDLAVMMRQSVNQKALTLLPGLVEMDAEHRDAAPERREAAPVQRPGPEIRQSDTRKAQPK